VYVYSFEAESAAMEITLN